MTHTDFIPMGFQYYRAPTPERSEWDKDLKNIKAYGYNTVKYWLQWRWNEPNRGEYTFDDIDELMDLAQKHGLKVVLNIILDVSPVWLTRDYPESSMITARGEKLEGFASEYRQIGGMPGPCFHHDDANRFKREFVAACAKRYANHPALLLWDVWNEPELTVGIYREPKAENLVCYCDACVATFRKWLEKRYGNIETLNRVWGRCYRSFAEAEPPKRHGTTSDIIDWREFFCDTLTDDFRVRVETVKQYDTVHPVMCHTVPTPLFNNIACCSDDFAMAKYGDLVGNSVGSNPMAADLLKSASRGKLCINSEIHAVFGSALNGFHIPDTNDMLRHIFIPLVHGSKGFLFWQYRPELLGNEAPCWGHSKANGENTEWNEITRKLHAVIRENEKMICDYHAPTGETAIYVDPANEIYSWSASFGTELFTRSLGGAYDLLYRNNYAVDFVNEEDVLCGNLKKYKAVYFPSVFLFDTDKTEKLRAYVEDGGIVLTEALFASIDQKSGRHCTELPGCGWAKLLGKTQGNVYSSTMIDNGYDGKVFTTDGGEKIRFEADGKPLAGAKYVATYTNDCGKPLAYFPDGNPAVCEYTLGKGKVIEFNTLFAYGYRNYGTENDLLFLRKIIGEPRMLPQIPAGVRADAVLSDGKGFVLVENTTPTEQTFDLPYVQTGETVGDVKCTKKGFVIGKGKTALIKINGADKR